MKAFMTILLQSNTSDFSNALQNGFFDALDVYTQQFFGGVKLDSKTKLALFK